MVLTADLQIRAESPNATRRYSASSTWTDSPIGSAFSIWRYFSWSLRLSCSSALSGFRRMEATVCGGLPFAPSSDHALLSNVFPVGCGSVMGSDICPVKPSPRRITTMRYWSARSNAFTVRSASSCTELGASTMLW